MKPSRAWVARCWVSAQPPAKKNGRSNRKKNFGNVILVEINGRWEWLLLASRCFSGGPAMIERVIAVKNRSHNPKTTDTKLQSFFHDQTGRSRPEAGLKPECRCPIFMQSRSFSLTCIYSLSCSCNTRCGKPWAINSTGHVSSILQLYIISIISPVSSA